MGRYTSYTSGRASEDFPIDMTYRVDALYRLALSSYYTGKFSESLGYLKKILEYDPVSVEAADLVQRIRRTAGKDPALKFPTLSPDLIQLSDDRAIRSSGSTIINIEHKLRELEEKIDAFRREGIVVTRVENALSDKTMNIDEIVNVFSSFENDAEEIRIIRGQLDRLKVNNTMRALVMALRRKVMDPANLETARDELENLEKMATERSRELRPPDLNSLVMDRALRNDISGDDTPDASKVVGLMCLGRLAYNKRRYQEAMDYFEKILNLDPEHKVAQKYHLECRIKQANRDQVSHS